MKRRLLKYFLGSGISMTEFWASGLTLFKPAYAGKACHLPVESKCLGAPVGVPVRKKLVENSWSAGRLQRQRNRLSVQRGDHAVDQHVPKCVAGA